jgi:hypothetical protein
MAMAVPRLHVTLGMVLLILVSALVGGVFWPGQAP